MNPSDCHISVVVIGFNGREFIHDCLATTFASLADNRAEVIVIDNGSTDGTPELIARHFPDACLIRNDHNTGFAAAVNKGLAEARGEYILILNQDTRIIADAVDKLAARMKRDNAIGTIGPKFIGFDGRLQKSARAFPRYRDLFFEFTGLTRLFPESKLFSRWKMGWFDHLTEKPVDQPMGAALMIRRSVVDEIGGFDENFPIFFNDVDFCRRVKGRGYVNLYYPEAVIEHFLGGSTRKMKAPMIIESHRAMYRYFRKYNRSLTGRPVLYFWGMILFLTARVRAFLARRNPAE